MNAIASCREASRLVSESLDHPLSLRQRIEMRSHMLVCSACRAYRRQLVVIDLLMQGRAAALADQGGGLSPAARDRVQQALRQRGGS